MEGLVFELGCWEREFLVLRWRLVEIGWLCWRERERDCDNGRCAYHVTFPDLCALKILIRSYSYRSSERT